MLLVASLPAQQLTVEGVQVKGVQTGAIAQGVAITTASPLPNCTQGVPYFQQFNVAGGTAPYTWAVISGSLQPGLAFSAQGVLSGTCSNNSGTANFTVQVTDSSTPPQSVSAPFAQTANGVGSGLAIPVCPSPGTPPNCPPSPFATNSFYQYAFLATGGTPPYAWTVTTGGLPTGLNLTTGGYLSGFPNGSQTDQITYNFTLQVTDSLLNTASQAYTIVITPTLGAAQVALEPQHWASVHMGGVNSSSGNPCAQSDTNCTWNLPILCDNAHNCTHEQLGFGTNDHPANLAGIYAAGCDWVALGQNRYMWVEVQLGPGLIHGTPSVGNEKGTDTGGAVYAMPVKYSGITSPNNGGTGCTAPANDYPAGVWTIPGTMAGTLQLGEIVTQASTGASAMITCIPGSSCYCPPNVLSNLGTCNFDPTAALTQPNLQIDSITGSNQGNGATADGTHVWTGQTSGATFTPSGVPIANGFFRVTGACDFAHSNTPCNNLPDLIPCYRGVTDSTYVDNENCTNDLPSMWQVNADTPGNTGAGSIIMQEGYNTAVSGVEVTLSPGSDQSMTATLCNNYPGVNCGSGNVGIKVKCGVCVRDHYYVHGWDPGDPGQAAFAQAHYPPVTNGGGGGSQGPSNPTSATQTGSNTSWTNLANIENSNVPGAQIGTTNGHQVFSNFAVGTGAGFSIPSNATILGVQIIDGTHISDTDSGNVFARTQSIQLVYNGSTIGNAKTAGPLYQQGVGAYPDETWGSNADTWSAALTPAIVNASTFGVQLETNLDATNSSRSATYFANVNNFRITVTYSIPGITQYNCPSWGNSLNNAFPVAYPTTAPYFLQGNFAQFAGGCGDDLVYGVNMIPAGPWADEYFTVTKIHLVQTETHGFQIGTGQGNTPAFPLPFGSESGPGKMAHFKIEAPSIAAFEGTVIWKGLEIRDGRLGSNPKYRFLTASSSNAPAACASLPCATNIVGVGVPVTNPLYGCNQGYWQDSTHFGSGKFNNGCPMIWAAKKCWEIKKAKYTMLDGIIYEFMWPDGQTGECLDLSINNTSGGPNIALMDASYVPMVPGEDVRHTNSIMRNASGGYGYRARSGSQSNGGGTSQGANRTYVNNFLVYNMDVVEFGNGSQDALQKYGGGNQSDTGVNWIANIATIDSGGQRTLVGNVDPITPTGISGIILCANTPPACPTRSDGTSYAGSIAVLFNGQRQDPINTAPGLFNIGQSYAYFTCNSPCGVTDPQYTTLLNASNIDCRVLPCTVGGVINPYAPTQLTGIYAPVCSPNGVAGTFPPGQPGVGDKQMMVGRACHNCGAGANSQCPDFGQTTVGPVTTYTSDLVCNGTGACGPANVQFPSWAFGIHDIGPSDIVSVTGCTNPALNTVPEPIVPNAYACAAGAVNQSQGNCTNHTYNTCAGTQNPGSLTLLYPGCSAANSPPGSGTIPYSSTTETCHFFNSAGWQKNFITNHYAVYLANVGRFAMTPFGYPSQSQQNQITNSIFYFGPNGGGFVCTSGGCVNKEANQGAYLALDQASNTINTNLFMLPTAARAALYTALNAPGFKICNTGVGPNSYVPTGGNCTLFGYSSPTSLGTPIATNCATTQTLDGPTGVPVCAGLTGYLSLGTWPTGDCTFSTFGSCVWASPPFGTFDYHGFNLCATCYLGGKNFFSYLATDGVQLGPCIGPAATCTNLLNNFSVVSIDSALTRTKYVCTGSCGTGPWPD